MRTIMAPRQSLFRWLRMWKLWAINDLKTIWHIVGYKGIVLIVLVY